MRSSTVDRHQDVRQETVGFALQGKDAVIITATILGLGVLGN